MSVSPVMNSEPPVIDMMPEATSDDKKMSPPAAAKAAPSKKIGDRGAKVGEASASSAPEATEQASGSSTRTRRPRDQEGGAGLESRASEFRSMATGFREQAKSETGNRAENLNARADRADAAADRMDAAAVRWGGGSAAPAAEPEMPPANPEMPPANDVGTKPAKTEESKTEEAKTGEGAGSEPVEVMDSDDTKVEEQQAEVRVVENEMNAKKSAPTYTPEPAGSPAKDGMIPASAMMSSGYWSSAVVDGEDTMVWNPQSSTGKSMSNYGKPDQGQSLSFKFSPSTSGEFLISLRAGRMDSAVNMDEKNSAKGIHDKGNDVYVQVRDLDTGQLVSPPEKFLVRVNNNGDKILVGNEFSIEQGRGRSKQIPATVDLKAGGNYQVELLGRSDGFAVAGASVTPK